VRRSGNPFRVNDFNLEAHMETNLDVKMEKGKVRLIPIAFADEGSLVIIDSVRGGQSLKKRLADRGFLPGEAVRIIKNCRFGGPMLLEIRGARYGIGRGEAQKILVDDHRVD
jgi:Fe2+ transport system protein FeoA